MNTHEHSWCYTSFKISLKITIILKNFADEMNHIFGLYTLQNWHIMNKSEAVCYSPSWEYSEYWIISSWVSTSHIESEVCVPTREKKHETGLLPHLATSKSSGSSRGEDKNLEKWCMDIILAQKCPRTWKYQKKPWKIDNVVVIHILLMLLLLLRIEIA